jgi:hypothetical protein
MGGKEQADWQAQSKMKIFEYFVIMPLHSTPQMPRKM